MKRDKQKQLTHLFAGVIFILVALYILEQHDILMSIITVGLGSLFLVVAGIHEWLMKTYKDVSLFIIFVEAACMLSIAFDFFQAKVYTFFYTFTVLGLLYLIIIAYLFATRKKKYKHRSRRRSSATEL